LRGLGLICATLVLAALAVGVVARAPAAQTTGPEACRPGDGPILAAALPQTVELAECPIGGQMITDNGVGAVVPGPGQGIYVHSLTTEGSQELEVTRYRDGTVELEHVGDETQAAGGEREIGAAGGPGECSDDAFNVSPDFRVEGDLRWYFNPRTTPDELSRKGAVRAIRRGTTAITGARNNCGLGDPVDKAMSYEGSTKARAQVGSGGGCNDDDERTVVSFGTLPEHTLAVTCVMKHFVDGSWRTKWSDIMLDKAHHNWTTRPKGPSCKGRYDVESTVAHERGHTFGLGHVSESGHGNLTMSDTSNGPCQLSERSLGRGDVLGLRKKY
jgi:hypothetical protein